MVSGHKICVTCFVVVLCCAVPVLLLSRPMKDLIEQVAAGYSYTPVSWQDVAAYSLNQQSGQVRTLCTSLCCV